MSREPLLRFERVSRVFGGGRTLLRRSPEVHAVDDVTLTLDEGSSLGLVGGSGSGKSTVARLATGLLAPSSGQVLLDGAPLDPADPRTRRALQLVFQHPAASLNPRQVVRRAVEAPLRAFFGRSRSEARRRAVALLEEVGLPPALGERLPSELSGGQAQRVAIARALAAEPRLLVLDEATAALDVSIQAQVLTLLDDLRTRRGLTFLFVSHDLPVVEALCEELAVMRSGRIVERGPRERVLHHPEHPYTRALLEALPRLDPGKE